MRITPAYWVENTETIQKAHQQQTCLVVIWTSVPSNVGPDFYVAALITLIILSSFVAYTKGAVIANWVFPDSGLALEKATPFKRTVLALIIMGWIAAGVYTLIQYTTVPWVFITLLLWFSSVYLIKWIFSEERPLFSNVITLNQLLSWLQASSLFFALWRVIHPLRQKGEITLYLSWSHFYQHHQTLLLLVFLNFLLIAFYNIWIATHWKVFWKSYRDAIQNRSYTLWERLRISLLCKNVILFCWFIQNNVAANFFTTLFFYLIFRLSIGLPGNIRFFATDEWVVALIIVAPSIWLVLSLSFLLSRPKTLNKLIALIGKEPFQKLMTESPLPASFNEESPKLNAIPFKKAPFSTRTSLSKPPLNNGGNKRGISVLAPFNKLVYRLGGNPPLPSHSHWHSPTPHSSTTALSSLHRRDDNYAADRYTWELINRGRSEFLRFQNEMLEWEAAKNEASFLADQDWRWNPYPFTRAVRHWFMGRGLSRLRAKILTGGILFFINVFAFRLFMMAFPPDDINKFLEKFTGLLFANPKAALTAIWEVIRFSRGGATPTSETGIVLLKALNTLWYPPDPAITPLPTATEAQLTLAQRAYRELYHPERRSINYLPTFSLPELRLTEGTASQFTLEQQIELLTKARQVREELQRDINTLQRERDNLLEDIERGKRPTRDASSQTKGHVIRYRYTFPPNR